MSSLPVRLLDLQPLSFPEHSSHLVVKYVPEWFPGANFKRLARKWRASTQDVVELPWAAFKDKYVGSGPRS